MGGGIKGGKLGGMKSALKKLRMDKGSTRIVPTILPQKEPKKTEKGQEEGDASGINNLKKMLPEGGSALYKKRKESTTHENPPGSQWKSNLTHL